MELISVSKRVVYQLFFIVLFYVILIWFSIFLYGITYYLYIPAIAHIRPVYLQYSPACLDHLNVNADTRSQCSFPSANVSLVQKGQYELLSRSQYYTVEITLEMPESETNRKQGMFMIQMEMLSQNGEIIQSSSRPALLHYKSPLFKTIYTFFFSPGLLAGTVEEKQILIIPIFEQYEEDPYRTTHFVRVEVQARNIEIYSASLRIHAQFTGLRYFMYYWPLLSAVIGVFGNFFFLSVSVLFSWLKFSSGSGDVQRAHPPLKRLSEGKVISMQTKKEIGNDNPMQGRMSPYTTLIHEGERPIAHEISSVQPNTVDNIDDTVVDSSTEGFGDSVQTVQKETDDEEWRDFDTSDDESDLVAALRRRERRRRRILETT